MSLPVVEVTPRGESYKNWKTFATAEEARHLALVNQIGKISLPGQPIAKSVRAYASTAIEWTVISALFLRVCYQGALYYYPGATLPEALAFLKNNPVADLVLSVKIFDDKAAEEYIQQAINAVSAPTLCLTATAVAGYLFAKCLLDPNPVDRDLAKEMHMKSLLNEYKSAIHVKNYELVLESLKLIKSQFENEFKAIVKNTFTEKDKYQIKDLNQLIARTGILQNYNLYNASEANEIAKEIYVKNMQRLATHANISIDNQAKIVDRTDQLQKEVEELKKKINEINGTLNAVKGEVKKGITVERLQYLSDSEEERQQQRIDGEGPEKAAQEEDKEQKLTASATPPKNRDDSTKSPNESSGRKKK